MISPSLLHYKIVLTKHYRVGKVSTYGLSNDINNNLKWLSGSLKHHKHTSC